MSFRKVIFLLVVAFSVGAVCYSTWRDTAQRKLTSPQPRTTPAHSKEKQASAAFSRVLFELASNAFAGEEGEDGGKGKGAKCDSGLEEKLGQHIPAYGHGALSHFANMFYLLNVRFPAGPENALCHFVNSMGMDPDLNALPLTITKTFGDRTITMEIATPTESWATAAGYTAKGSVTVNGNQYMILYWGGTGESSKGFMIEGAKGFSDDTRATYAQWDRTDSTAQTIKIYAAKWNESLGLSASISGDDTDTGVIYGEATYNSTSKEMSVKVVSLEARSNAGNVQKCYKMAGSGTKGGQIQVAKESGSSGMALNDTNKDSTGMEGVYLLDSTETENLCQGTPTDTCRPLTSDELSTLCTFTYSCDDVSGAGDTGGVFESDDAQFDTCPAVVFEGAGSC